jgi:glycosyltransferase involved in cell wall biosynthesis
MKLLIATDAWAPQVNGVVRTLQATIREIRSRGIEVVVVEPSRFLTVGMPTYPDIRLALVTQLHLNDILAREMPDNVHISTEGPIGLAARKACIAQGRRFTTSYHTRFPEYLSARAPVPENWSYALLRRFHRPSARVLVSTESLRQELSDHGFSNLALWPRGVDTELFHPRDIDVLNLPRPIFLSVGRLAVEKNIDGFLSLDLPGSKVVVGDGPQAAELKARFPKAHFLGMRSGQALAEVYASADVFVFPSLTDTYGIVLLEAAASGLPSAAFPVTGPRDVIGNSGIGILDDDLRRAAMAALRIPRDNCRAFALQRSWASATDAFLAHVMPQFGSSSRAA